MDSRYAAFVAVVVAVGSVAFAAVGAGIVQNSVGEPQAARKGGASLGEVGL